MLKFTDAAGTVVAADSRSAIAAMDGALLSGMRMCMSFIEATQGSNMPAVRSQKLIASMSSGITAVVEGRGQLVSAVRQLAAIKRDSNLAPMDFGCPEGWDEVMTPAGANVSAPTEA